MKASVNLKYEIATIDGDEEEIGYQLFGLDDVGFMWDENMAGRWKIWNTKQILTVEPAVTPEQFNAICKAVEDAL